MSGTKSRATAREASTATSTDDKAQAERLIETARKLDSKEGEREFVRAVNVILAKPAKSGRSRKRGWE